MSSDQILEWFGTNPANKCREDLRQNANNVETMNERQEVQEMIGQMKQIEELMKELPPDLQDQVRDFADFLLRRRQEQERVLLRQDRTPALNGLRDKYPSAGFRRKLPGWRMERG